MIFVLVKKKDTLPFGVFWDSIQSTKLLNVTTTTTTTKLLVSYQNYNALQFYQLSTREYKTKEMIGRLMTTF